MFVLSNIKCVVISTWKLWTIKKRQPRFGITRNIANVPIYAFALHNDFFCLFFFFDFFFFSHVFIFFSEVLHSLMDISRIVSLFTKQTKKQSRFSTTSGTSCDLSWTTSFPRLHSVSFGRKHRKVRCNISGLTYNINLAYNMHCAPFQEFLENAFRFSADLGVWNESTVKSGIFPSGRFENRF